MPRPPAAERKRVYLAAPHMGTEERALVAEAFESNWLSTVGPHLNAFEAEMGQRLGRHCVALASGTAAIHLGLRLLGVGAGDEVLCPTFTFVASVNPALYQGATPVLIDAEQHSWNLDPNLVEDVLRARARAGRRPKAMIVVQLFGQTAQMEALWALSEKFGVPILEDAAETLGGDFEGQPAGALAPVGALSFNGNKIITTTGGGMLTTSDPAWADKARFWSTQARDPGVAYEHSEVGFNYRLSNVLAGIGRGQLRVLDERVEQKRALFRRYCDAFVDLDGVSPAPEAGWGRHTRWLSCFVLDEAVLGVTRDSVVAALGAENIEARPVWKPMHLQPLLKRAEVVGGQVAEGLFASGICLPSSTNLAADEQTRVIEVIRRTVGAGGLASG